MRRGGRGGRDPIWCCFRERGLAGRGLAGGMGFGAWNWREELVGREIFPFSTRIGGNFSVLFFR